ncbi:nicotianamine synthase family protein [Caldalkalibacillus mannanilyticus]|uniref:nicotianamine synthase family protein n=1 Tax=Caldalkalibacillus mannanilyticus TaxID=1418 RepID=UPI00046AA1C9|nr:nicotianamine synthase family protein [Caldalkalibacillus mannanilyticus]
MRDKFELLLSLKLLEYEITELTLYSKECCDCFELLKNKLDDLCQFIVSEEKVNQWNVWGSHQEIQEYSNRVREASVKALCDIEKYQSICTCKNELDISSYLTKLSKTVKKELEVYQMDSTSKVLFIGSGAFPLSALTIAKEIKAEVLCVDIDLEAVELGQQVAKALGLESFVHFTNKNVKQLSFCSEATHIIIASLVPDKIEVLEDVKDCMQSSAKIIMRYGNGLKSIFNYPLEQDLSAEWVQTRITESTTIYDTLILEKAKSLIS